MYLKIGEILLLLLLGNAYNVRLNIYEPSLMKRQIMDMTCVIQINVKYVFHKTIKHTKLFILGGRDHERINLTDDLQLLSNHKRSFTEVILLGQNIYDMLYL